MSLTNLFANHLDSASDFGANPTTRELAAGEVDLPFPSNPFGISSDNYTDIGKSPEAVAVRKESILMFDTRQHLYRHVYNIQS